MRKTLIYKKRVQDETGREYILWYSLVIRVAEHGANLWRGNRKNKRIRTAGAGVDCRYLRRKKGNTVFSGKTLVRSCHAGRAECTV